MKLQSGLLLSAALVGSSLLVSCGGVTTNKSASSPTSGDSEMAAPMMVDESDPRAAISALSQNIEDLRAGQGLRREPNSEAVRSARDEPMPGPTSDSAEASHGSAGSQGSVCERTCTIKARICSNAKKICELAEGLDGDPWADQKCDTGKVSCKEAKEQCDACSS